jgi:hypothetical protein
MGALLSVACSDPIHDQLVASLGPENPAIPPGPNHRAGQPCLACHGDSGPAAQPFTIGGTVYAKQYLPQPAPGAHVQVEDQEGHSTIIVANAVGNFYTSAPAFQPTYPIHMTVAAADYSGVPSIMVSASNREGSCATCHYNPAGPNSPGPLFVLYNPTHAAQ